MPRRDAEPSAAELAAIEAEWPVTAAELVLLDAEIRVLCAPGQPSPLDWRRLRHARRQLLAAEARQASRRRELAATGAGAVAS